MLLTKLIVDKICSYITIKSKIVDASAFYSKQMSREKIHYRVRFLYGLNLKEDSLEILVKKLTEKHKLLPIQSFNKFYGDHLIYRMYDETKKDKRIYHLLIYPKNRSWEIRLERINMDEYGKYFERDGGMAKIITLFREEVDYFYYYDMDKKIINILRGIFKCG